jgi:hypothetical protein
MVVDPLDRNLREVDFSNDANMYGDMITTVEPADAWSQWRDNLAIEMFNRWSIRNH